MFKHFKETDVVTNQSIWGKTLFEIEKFHGNDYLPLANAHMLGKPNTVEFMCTFDVREIQLVAIRKRPFKALKKETLMKLLKKGNIDAKREFIIRNKK